VAGGSGPAGPAGPIGPSHGYFTATNQRVTVTGNAASPLPIAALSFLPAGDYLVFARATAANVSGSGDGVQCIVRANGAPSRVSSIAVGTEAGFAHFGDISVAAPVSSGAQFNLDFACYHSQPEQAPYLEAVELSAIRLSTVDSR
jgi:hypothetical protein